MTPLSQATQPIRNLDLDAARQVIHGLLDSAVSSSVGRWQLEQLLVLLVDQETQLAGMAVDAAVAEGAARRLRADLAIARDQVADARRFTLQEVVDVYRCGGYHGDVEGFRAWLERQLANYRPPAPGVESRPAGTAAAEGILERLTLAETSDETFRRLWPRLEALERKVRGLEAMVDRLVSERHLALARSA